MRSIWEMNMKDGVSGAVAKMQSTVQRAFDQMGLNEQKLQGVMANTQRSVERTTGMFTGLKNTLLASFSLFSIIALGKQVVQIGSNMEQTRTAYNVLIGDIQKSDRAIAQLKTLADVTPFTNTEIFDAGKMLLGAQLPATQLASTLRQIGDISMGNSDVFNRMVQNYSQILANQRANTQDIKQFAFAGVPIWSELSKVIGKSGDALRKYVEGGVSVKVIDQVLRNLTSTGGQFYQMMQKQSETFAGRWSTFVGNLQTVAINIFNAIQPFLNAVLKLAMDLLPKVTAFFEKLWSKASGSLTRIGDSLGRIVNAVLQIVQKLGPALDDIINTVLPVMATGLEMIASVVADLLTYIANNKWIIQALGFAMKMVAMSVFGVVYAIGLAVKAFERLKGVFYGLWDSAKVVFSGIADTISKSLMGSAKLVYGIMTMNMDMIKQGFNEALQGSKNLLALPQKAVAAYTNGRDEAVNGKGSGVLGGVYDRFNQAAKSGAYKGFPLAGTSSAGAATSGSSELGSSGGGGGAGKNITFNVQTLVGEINIHAASVKESASEIKRHVIEAILTASNDVQAAM